MAQTLRKQYDSLRTQIKKFQAKNQELLKILYKKEDRLESIAKQIILDEKLLRPLEWYLDSSEMVYLNPNFRLKAVPSRKLIKLFKDLQYWRIVLESGIEFSLDEEQVRIKFNDPALIIYFIDKYELTVQTGNLSANVKDAKRKLDCMIELTEFLVGG